MRQFVVLFVWLSAGAAAQNNGRVGSASVTGDPIQDAIQLVSDTAIASDIRALEAFGSRYARYNNRFTIAEWIRQRFITVGVPDADTIGFMESSYLTWQRNVVATIPGSATGGEELVIGAHYDSQSSNTLAAPGADDNASGVAGIIEMARVLKAIGYQPRATIRFVAFAAEELGLHGAYDYADKAFTAGTNILLMQNYDMIGYRDTTEGDRNVSVNEYQAAIPEADLMVSLMQTYTTLTPHKTSENITRSDSWPFALRFFKPVFVIEDERDFNPFYHSPRDSSTYLDFTYAAEIVQAGIAMTLTVDGQITSVSGPEENVPQRWMLDQNYPNPFNPSTDIRYTVARDGVVHIVVHNVLGEQVTTLTAGWHPAGKYTVRWIPDVPSGTYYYTLLAYPAGSVERAQRITRKMVLVQ